MNRDFRMGTLSEIIDFRNGKSIKKTDGVVPIYGGNGVLGYSNDSNYSNTLIIGRVGAYCGSVHIEHNKCWVSDNAIAGLPKNGFSNVYNYYLLQSLQLNEHKIGSSQPLLTQGILNNIRVKIHFDLEQQKKIATALSLLDAKIENNNRINSELEAMAKTLYDYWFVQFNFPGENGKPYKFSGGRMVYNTKLKREIPSEWKVHKIDEVLEVVLGGTPSTSNTDYWENGTINWLNSGEMNAFPVVQAASRITKKALDNSATKLMPSGSVAISITRYIRPTILAIDSCANQSVVGVYESSTFKNSYLYPFFVNEVSRYMTVRTGAMQPHINKETIKETLIIEPPSQILSKYYEIVNPIYQKIINNAKENLELIQLRDWLLPLLMNGQVNVTNILSKHEQKTTENIDGI